MGRLGSPGTRLRQFGPARMRGWSGGAAAFSARQLSPSAYYSNESGVTVDDTGNGHTLTSHGGVTNPTGKVGKGAGFAAASSQFLSIADNAFCKLTGDRTFAGWVKLTDKSAVYMIASKDDGAGNREWLIYYDSGTDRFHFLVFDAGTFKDVAADAFGSPTAGVFYFLAVRFTVATSLLEIGVNGGTFNTATLDTPPARTIGVQNMDIGGREIVSFENYLNGATDEWGFYPSVLSNANVTNLAAGVTY